MYALNSSLALWCLVGIHIGGLCSAVLARATQGTRLESPSHRLFFLAMAVVGVAMMGSLPWSRGCCLALGTTLSLMVLTVVWDVRGQHELTLDR